MRFGGKAGGLPYTVWVTSYLDEAEWPKTESLSVLQQKIETRQRCGGLDY